MSLVHVAAARNIKSAAALMFKIYTVYGTCVIDCAFKYCVL